MTHDNQETGATPRNRNSVDGVDGVDGVGHHSAPDLLGIAEAKLRQFQQAPPPGYAEYARLRPWLEGTQQFDDPKKSEETKKTSAANAPTERVLAHLEEVAEQAILAQCAVIRELIAEAQSLDNMLMADLARIRDTLRVGISTGTRAAKLAQSIRDVMNELKNNHDDVKTQT
jgi:siroheme synthase (precorrin-2 oxidase/ferrochelatase)